jgi:hypothetical protein
MRSWLRLAAFADRLDVSSGRRCRNPNSEIGGSVGHFFDPWTTIASQDWPPASGTSFFLRFGCRF